MTTIEQLKASFGIGQEELLTRISSLRHYQDFCRYNIEVYLKTWEAVKGPSSFADGLEKLGLVSYERCFLPTSEYTHHLTFSSEVSSGYPVGGFLLMFEVLDSIKLGRQVLVEEDNYMPSLPDSLLLELREGTGIGDLANVYVNSQSESFACGRNIVVRVSDDDRNARYYLPVILSDEQLFDISSSLLTLLKNGQR